MKTTKPKAKKKKYKRSYIKKLVSTSLLADFFGMQEVDVNKHFSKGHRLDFIYIVFNRNELSQKQKKDYLYSLSLSTEMKDNIWQRFCGDYWFEYCKTTSNSLEVRI